MIASPSFVYFDHAGHELLNRLGGFDGSWVISEKKYDHLGLLFETYQARFERDAAILASRQIYDDLGRVKKVTVLDELGNLQDATIAYIGLKTVHTNAKLQVRTETKNAIGKLVSVVDAKSGITQFAYDLAGNLRQTIDPNGNIITVTYDLYGRKTDLRDPDLGWIHYELDPLGRVLAQTSPKQRDLGASTTKPHLRTLMEYDLLDRMTARYEMDLESHWVFDSAPNGKGLLWESYTGPATAKTYFRTHSYDVLSRPQQTVEQLADGQYRSSIIYDAWGRVIQQSYQRQQNATKAFATRYNKFGFAERFERGSLVLGAIKSMDAAARPTSILLGNGLLATQNYYANTGRLDTSNLAPNGNSAQIRLAQKYEYDKLGNVTLRSQSWDANEKFTERFDYDVLNRISFSRVDNQAQQNFTYDAVGNLLSKTGVGTGSYVYPTQGVNAVRPHAPQSIPGIGSFEYDNNGNLINGAGRSITWTSFDMPLQISKGSITAKFSYGPEHNRIKQERSDGSTEIYAGAQIVEKDAAGILTIKTYWPAGLGLEIDRPQASNSELNWTHVDKLGSVIAISDEAGNFREKMAYDAWGKRRTLSGAAINGTATPDNIDGKVDHRGFTNHEMLDQLDLVHMNGRIYEPLLARFLSADPILQDPLNGQSYNRYAYVMNNPTNLTDPTGFEATTKEVEKGKGCVVVTGSGICHRSEIAAANRGLGLGVKYVGGNPALAKELKHVAASGLGATQTAKDGSGGVSTGDLSTSGEKTALVQALPALPAAAGGAAMAMLACNLVQVCKEYLQDKLSDIFTMIGGGRMRIGCRQH